MGWIITIIFIIFMIYGIVLVQSGKVYTRESSQNDVEAFLYQFEAQIDYALGDYAKYECAADIRRYWIEMLKRLYERELCC